MHHDSEIEKSSDPCRQPSSLLIGWLGWAAPWSHLVFGSAMPPLSSESVPQPGLLPHMVLSSGTWALTFHRRAPRSLTGALGNCFCSTTRGWVTCDLFPLGGTHSTNNVPCLKFQPCSCQDLLENLMAYHKNDMNRNK